MCVLCCELFNTAAADVKYFQKVELHTKYGRHGHIVDSVGTHGRMRCRFDQHIHNHDTLLMSLYKRVFPVWNATSFLYGPLDTS